MRTTFPNKMVAHVWAQQNQAEGRGSSFYFRDTTIYSYGSHFPIARFVKNKRGESAVFFTTRGYSNSTAKHINYTRSALRDGLPIFYTKTPDVTDHKAMLEEYASRVKEALLDASRARLDWRKQTGIERAQRLGDERNAYVKFFGLRNKPLALPAGVLEKLPEIRRRAAAEEKLRAKKQMLAAAQREAADRKRREEARVAYEKSKAEWLAGDCPQFYSQGWEKTLLRVKGEVVQTSRGAEVPVEHAKRLWPIIQRVRASGREYVRNGHSEHVGHFTVDKIDVTGDLHIGCHHIPYNEVERIAGVLGLLATEAGRLSASGD